MDLDLLISQMAENAGRVRCLVEGLGAEQSRWKPNHESWSVLEVVNHLYDEEQYDFRVRLDIILHNPERPWPPIDPGGWVVERQYNQRDLAESLEGFLREREGSLAWLRGLLEPDWGAVYQAPFGQITAGDMFAAWVAHDLLHTRQLVEILWAHTGVLVSPYSTEYAGSW